MLQYIGQFFGDYDLLCAVDSLFSDVCHEYNLQFFIKYNLVMEINGVKIKYVEKSLRLQVHWLIDPNFGIIILILSHRRNHSCCKSVLSNCLRQISVHIVNF
jgi:hypothetical protein